MAKWGEGDPRWIVEERPDATNVNNWHWVEKNATPWSKERLNELLTKQSLSDGHAKIEFKELNKLEGEASANNRKAKLIFFFEWTIVIDFEASIDDSEMKYKGTIEILNLSDENEADEIQISAHIANPGPHESHLLKMLNTEGLAFIRGQLGKYISELKREFSQGLILPTDKGEIRPQAISTKGKTVVDKRSFQNAVETDKCVTEKKKSEFLPTGEFELVETFKVPPDRLFEILTEPSLVSAWCPNSSLNAVEDGKFSLLGGIISGTFTNIKKDKEISMNWRLKDYPQDVFAHMTFTLCDKGDCVDLQVRADGVPIDAINKTKEGFARFYFQAIGRRFGITLSLM